MEERALAKKVSAAARYVREHLAQQEGKTIEEVTKTVDGDWSRGYLFMKIPGDGTRSQKIFVKSRTSDDLEMAKGWEACGLQRFDTQDALAKVNQL